MEKFLVVLFAYALEVGLGVLIMVNGYGVQVKSWAWIIGGALIGRVLIGRVLIETMNGIIKQGKK